MKERPIVFTLHGADDVEVSICAIGHCDIQEFMTEAKKKLLDNGYTVDDHPRFIMPPRHVFGRWSDSAPLAQPTERSQFIQGSIADPALHPFTYVELEQ